MSNGRTLYEHALRFNPVPEWNQLGSVTQSVWIERAEAVMNGVGEMLHEAFLFGVIEKEEAMSNEITISDIQEALGIPVRGDFIQNVLMVPATRTDKRALFWDEYLGHKIKKLLIEHIKDCPDITPCERMAKPVKVKVKAKQVAMDYDDDEL